MLIVVIILCLLYLLSARAHIYEKFVLDTWDSNTELIIVSAHYNEDLNWLLKAPVPVIVCGKEGEKDSVIPSNPKCKTINEGNEASSYIKFIIEYYGNLPQYMLFIHGHETSPHQTKDIYNEIASKKWLNKDYYSVNKMGLFDGHIGINNEEYALDWVKIVWDKHFRPYLKRDPPEEIKVDCCAQFIISKKAILKYPKEAWENWYIFLTNDYKNYIDNFGNSRNAAIMFEYIWHIIFGQPNIMTEL